MQLTLDSAILEHLLERAAMASRLVGHIDERVGVTLVGSLGDSVDAIVHVLSELLGNPHVVFVLVPSSSSSTAGDVVAHGNADTRLVGAEVVTPNGARRLRPLSALGCARRRGHAPARFRRGGVR